MEGLIPLLFKEEVTDVSLSLSLSLSHHLPIPPQGHAAHNKPVDFAIASFTNLWQALWLGKIKQTTRHTLTKWMLTLMFRKFGMRLIGTMCSGYGHSGLRAAFQVLRLLSLRPPPRPQLLCRRDPMSNWLQHISLRRCMGDGNLWWRVICLQCTWQRVCGPYLRSKWNWNLWSKWNWQCSWRKDSCWSWLPRMRSSLLMSMMDWITFFVAIPAKIISWRPSSLLTRRVQWWRSSFWEERFRLNRVKTCLSFCERNTAEIKTLLKARGWCQPPWLGFCETWQATNQKSTSMTRRSVLSNTRKF